MKTTLLLAKTLLLRIFRDPVTLIVLFAIPALLIVVFGAFLGNTDNINLKVAVINSSTTEFGKNFQDQISKVDILSQPEKITSLDEAKQKVRDGKLQGVIELPVSFGQIVDGNPKGTVVLYYEQSDTTGEILSGVVSGLIDETNTRITGTSLPLSLEQQLVAVNSSKDRTFDSLFAMFTAMALMMVGLFGVASTIPYDKKAGILRRLRATPLKGSQLSAGIMIAYALVGVAAVALMTSIAVLAFGLEMRGQWLHYSIFMLAALIMMLSFGMAIGGWAKNTTQSDVYGQIVFLGSLALSGLWFPLVLMPEWLQSIAAYLPLTATIDGIQQIVTQGASIVSLGSQLAVIAGWLVVTFIVGVKVFKWE